MFNKQQKSQIPDNSTRSYNVYCFSHFIAPSAPPQYPSGSVQSATTITLQWDPPPLLDINGEIDHYVVELVEVYTAQTWTFSTTDNYLNISSLHAFYTYKYRIACFTIQLGPFTSYSYVTTSQAGEVIFVHASLCKKYTKFFQPQFQVEYHKISQHHLHLHLQQSYPGHLLSMRNKMVSLLTMSLM